MADAFPFFFGRFLTLWPRCLLCDAYPIFFYKSLFFNSTHFLAFKGLVRGPERGFQILLTDHRLSLRDVAPQDNKLKSM